MRDGNGKWPVWLVVLVCLAGVCTVVLAGISVRLYAVGNTWQDVADRGFFESLRKQDRTIHDMVKPVIYLYPEEDMTVHVSLRLDGEITASYPEYPEGGWYVLAHPDGMIDYGGKTYRYLYWEGEDAWEPDFSAGFNVTPDTALDFLEGKLTEIGLTEYEKQEMIVYWLPVLLRYDYSIVSFQTDAYTSHAALEIDPAPDSLLRVFMAVTPVDGPVDVPPQVFEPFVRDGFTVVEWGGCDLGGGR